VNAFQTVVVFEVVNCLAIAGYDNNVLVDDVEKWRDKCTALFSVNIDEA
jgi:hypothetical protein